MEASDVTPTAVSMPPEPVPVELPASAELPDRLTARRQKHNETMKLYFRNNPEQAMKKSVRVCEKYHSDPEYRARVIARAREQTARKRAARLAAIATSQVATPTSLS
jgi:vancomycin resistance protein YoaR